MAHFNRDGVNLYYEVHGDGPPLLLTHGFSATSQMWRGQIEALSKNHTLIIWDMRGHGESDAPEDLSLYSEAHTVADMAALLDHLGFDEAIIGGLSLGGYMSLAFHCDHPERVKALLIIDTGPGFKKDEAREAWNKTAIASAENIEKNGAAALESGSAERRISTHKEIMGVARAGRGMLTQHTSRVIHSLPDIAKPALVLVGALDEPFLVATDYMAAKIPGAEKLVIPDAGHASNIDQKDAFNEGVSEFLKAKGL